ncbi:MAG: ABC transporter permease, partial [Clostridia bacterium]|nr:ABC transporter permease [Clostridia bacterium]
MAVSFKDAIKFVGIIIVACCAALVCNLFLNYDVDLRAIESLVEDGSARTLYDALKLTNTVVCAVSGGCLVLTSVIMLVFYIGHYIEANSAKFGILKALGYNDLSIASKCAVFGFCIFVGIVVGVAVSWAIMPSFYAAQNDNDGVLPNIALKFHAWLPLLLILVPTAVFALIAVGIAYVKLRLPALALIRG